MTGRVIVTCPNDGVFLIEWCTFPDGRPTLSEEGRGVTWREEWVGDFDGRAVSATPEGEAQHYRFSITCNACESAGRSYGIMLRSETAATYLHPILAHLHNVNGTQTVNDLPRLIRQARRGAA